MSDPTAALQQLLQPGSLAQTLFPANSRYAGVPIATIERADGTTIAYVRRRFVPPPESYAPLAQHTIAQGERLDIIAARYLGDAELFWRICDANAAIWPQALETEGTTVQI